MSRLYISLVFIFLILISCPNYNINRDDIPSTDYIELNANSKYEFIVTTRRQVNIIILSVNNKPFKAKVFKTNGVTLKYKTRLMKLQGKLDIIQLENPLNHSNTVTMRTSKMEKTNKYNLTAIIGILTTIVVIIYEKRSLPTRILLFVFLIIQLYEMPKNVIISERIFRKLLF